MKVQELRDIIKKADRENVEKAFAECYKKLSKSQKQELDQMLEGILSGKDTKGPKEGPPADFPALKREVEEFLENAYAQNYFAPNRVIPKSKRPKWRFMVKGYIKEFLKIKAEDEHYPEMIRLFSEIYKLICTACNYYLFSTEDPFRSIGWNQPELFRVLVKKMFEDGYTKENILAITALAVCEGVSRETLHVEQAFVLVSELRTSDVKYMTLESVKELADGQEGRLSGLKNNSDQSYFIEETINRLCDLYLIISIELTEAEDGIRYYFDHCREYRNETILYRALEIVDWTDAGEKLWIDVYRYGLTRKIEPREELTAKYQELIQKQNERQLTDDGTVKPV